MARIQGSTGTPAPAAPQRTSDITGPSLPAYPRFFFMAHPQKWTIIDGRVVAALFKLPIQSGIGGVGGDLDADLAIAKKRKRGWTLIPEDVDGPGTTYIAAHELRRGAVAAYASGGQAQLNAIQSICFLPKWVIVHNGTDRCDTDAAGYADFLEGLEDKGVIDSPHLWVLDAKISTLTKSMQKYQDVGRTKPSLLGPAATIKAQIEVYEAKAKELRAKSGRSGTPAPPAPKPPAPTDAQKADIAKVVKASKDKARRAAKKAEAAAKAEGGTDARA